MVRKPLKVCVVGSLNMDTVASVDNRAFDGHSQANGPQRKLPGGIGANHAMAIHRMSHFKDLTTPPEVYDANFPYQVSVSIVGKVGGQDDYGKKIMKELEDVKIDTHAVGTAQDHDTGTAYIQLDPSGRSNITNQPNANHQLSAADVGKAWPGPDVRMVVVSLEILPKTACKAIQLAKKHNVPVVLNLTPSPKPALLNERQLFDVDHLIMNDKDADSILSLPIMSESSRRDRSVLQNRYGDASIRFHGFGASCVVITLGEMGVLASCLAPMHDDSGNGQKCRRLFFYDAQIGPQGKKDLTGASNAFVGAYAVEILRQLYDDDRGMSPCRVDISTALDMGIRAGGYSVGIVGGMNGCPWRDDIVGRTAGPFRAARPFSV